MKNYNITKNNLYLDLDAPYDKQNNKIDVYSDVYWSAETKEDYEAIEDKIFKLKIDNELFSISCWCDVSGFDYWSTQKEPNYISIDVYLKKEPILYSQKEIEQIRESIINTNKYFISIAS